MPLETVKLEGVSVMAVGGPYRGKGSPPQGDFFDVAKLQQIADASNALHDAGELRPVNKIGHDPNQRLLRDSGITDGEKPAAGWLRNFRVDGDKLKADIENVPKKLADLIKAGAYRTRSAELRTLESQRGSGVTGPAVTGLAWLGAVGPAIRNLDDVYAYYADSEIDEDVIVVDYSEEPVPWEPDRGFRWVQAQIAYQLDRDFHSSPDREDYKDKHPDGREQRRKRAQERNAKAGKAAGTQIEEDEVAEYPGVKRLIDFEVEEDGSASVKVETEDGRTETVRKDAEDESWDDFRAKIRNAAKKVKSFEEWREFRFNPRQKRAKDGKWTDGFAAVHAVGGGLIGGGAPWNPGGAQARAMRKKRGAPKLPKDNFVTRDQDKLKAAARAQLKKVDAEIARKEALLRSLQTPLGRQKIGGAFQRDDLNDELRRLRKRQSKLRRSLGADNASQFKPDFQGPKVYVADVGPSSALLIEYGDDGEAAWIADFEIDEDDLLLAPREEWVLSESSWTDDTRDFLHLAEQVRARPADTSGVSEITITDEQVKQFAEVLGLEEDEVTAEDILTGLAASKEFSDENDLAKLKANAEAGQRAERRLFEQDRERVVGGAVAAHKLKPADREEWDTRYEENPELITKVLDDMPVSDELAREFGDDTENDDDEATEREFDELADYLGIDEGDRAGKVKA